MTTTSVPQLVNGSLDVVASRTTASFTVRKLGLIKVHGTIKVDEGSVTIVDGEPVAASATLDAASVSTGIKKRDSDLAGKHFFATAEHPQLRVRVMDVHPDDDGWTATATITVAGGTAPLELRVVREPDTGDGSIRVRATGVLDRSATPIKAPRWLVGRYVGIEVDAILRPPS